MAGAVNNAATPLPQAAQPQAAQPQANAQANAGAGTNTALNNQQADQSLERSFQTQYQVQMPGVGQTTLTGGINMLAKIFSVRQTRLADISLALADYTNKTGQLNQAAVIKVQQENSANDILNALIKSLFDKQQETIRAWTQLR